MGKMTFETALKELEETVKKLESDELTLDESIKLYTKGNELSAFCLKQLEEAKLKITDISKVESQE